MGHIQARKDPDVVPGQFEVSSSVIRLLSGLLAEGKDIDVATAHLNRAWMYGEIDGVPAPIIASDGTVIDPHKQRGFSLRETAAIAALPETVEAVARLQEQRAQVVAEQRHEARVAQLAVARLIKQAKAERQRCPLLYQQVEALVPTIQWLVERAFDQCPYEVVRVLPELAHDESAE